MIETTSSLEPFEVDDLDAATLLAHAEDAEAQARRADRRRLRLAAQWCVLHPATAETGPMSWAESGHPSLLHTDEGLGGEGTPAVAAFTAEPLAAALGLSPDAAVGLLADVLDLVHRLPLLWRAVEELRLPAWQAREVATRTRSLSRDAARWVDGRLATYAAFSWRRVEDTLATAVARFHPERLEAHERRGRHGWDVTLHHQRDAQTRLAGTSHLSATGDSQDLSRFYDLVCDTAAELGVLGDTDPLGARRAKALGVIADAQASLDLRALTGDGADADASEGLRRRAPATLYLHLGLADLAGVGDIGLGDIGLGDIGLGRDERLGAVSVQTVREWLGHARVTVRPVLDLSRDDAVDPHDPPDWMRELVMLRDPHCVFPGCGRRSRACDLDHIDPYDEHGPPGQTRPSGLAPLCRRHHRLKTSGRWRYRRRGDGTYQWHSPHGVGYLVTRDGTLRIPLS